MTVFRIISKSSLCPVQSTLGSNIWNLFLCPLYIADHIFLWKEPTMYVLVFSLGHLESTAPYNDRRVIFFLCVSQNK